jgi:hypothetical protein
MDLIPIQPEERPNIMTPDSKKDRDYDRRSARYFLSRNEYSYINDFRLRYSVNKRYAEGNYWPVEDIQTFLQDRSGKARNRVMLSQNVFRPIIEQHRASVLNMSINATAEATTTRAKTRKEEALGKMKVLSQQAQMGAYASELLQGTYAVDESEEATEAAFHNYYQDCVVKAINDMIDISAQRNRFKEMAVNYAYDMDVGGLVGSLCTVHQNTLFWQRLDPMDIIWDTTCKLNDFTDAEFVAAAVEMSLEAIGERHNPPEDQMRSMADVIRTAYGNQGAPVGRRKLPVHYVYYQDVTYKERGYIKNQFGEPELVEIDGVGYTDDDLMEVPEFAREEFGNKKKRREIVEVIRYCVLVPREYILSAEVGKNDRGDWVLESGEYPLQEEDWFDTSITRFPIKLSAWCNSGGRVIAPLSDAVSSQRLLNQVLVTFSGLLAMTGGSGSVISSRGLDPNYPEDKVHMGMKDGETIILDDKGRGISNVIGRYDNTPQQGLYNLLQIVPFLSNSTKEMTSSTDAIRGQQQGADQAVGVTKMMIDRGIIMQQPILYSISMLYKQMYEFDAQAGKKFYATNPAKLEEIVGMDEVAAILATPDALLERVRVHIKMDSDHMSLVEAGNQQIFALLQMQQLDGLAASEMWGRSTPDQVAEGWRKYSQLRAQAAKKEQFDMERQQQMQAIALQQAENDRQQQEVYSQALEAAEAEKNRETKIRAPYDRARAASMFPPPEPAGAPPSRQGRTQPMTFQPGTTV